MMRDPIVSTASEAYRGSDGAGRCFLNRVSKGLFRTPKLDQANNKQN
jgi:hypothetical protein